MKTTSLPIIGFCLLAADLSAQAQNPPPPPQGRITAQRPHAPPRVPNMSPGAPQLGDPLPGLTAAQLAAFGAGLDEFENTEDAAGGLGPIFNNVSCVSCHNSGGTGGGSPITVTRFGRTDGRTFDPLEALGGSLLQHDSLVPAAREVVPLQANVVAKRQSTPLFGLGLIAAIPEATIQRNAQRPPVNGIRGKVSLVTDVVSGQQRIGRFGWKAQQATLLAFSADAYLNEMGITSRFFPTENAPNGDLARLAEFDLVDDPEDVPDPATGKGDIDAVADYMQFLNAPPPLALTASAQMGRNLFAQLDCAVCHLPSMTTGRHPVAALSNKVVWLYSDLLLHDMGSLGDGIAQGSAGPREMKTPPLWGLRASAPYLHDGRAPSVDAAIRAHDGEGAGSRDKFLRLNPTQRQQLIDFVRSL